MITNRVFGFLAFLLGLAGCGDVPLVQVTGRLEKREGTINVLAERVEALSRPGRPEIGAEPRPDEADLQQLRAAAPHANSFARGRR